MDLSEKDFMNQKKQTLSGVDFSRKGSIDESIKDIVELLNNSSDFVTSSSCSGRVILFTENVAENERRKQNCKWIYTSHDVISSDTFVSYADPLYGDLIIKFEPFILHVQCRTLNSAKILQKCALESGFRNSGIVIGHHGKMTVAVRSTHGLEVPISNGGKLLVSNEYLEFLAHKVNEKMEENKIRTDRFRKVIRKTILSG